ncbi:unnamed protein product, partial [Iphiclides podalirius]
MHLPQFISTPQDDWSSPRSRPAAHSGLRPQSLAEVGIRRNPEGTGAPPAPPGERRLARFHPPNTSSLGGSTLELAPSYRRTRLCGFIT